MTHGSERTARGRSLLAAIPAVSLAAVVVLVWSLAAPSLGATLLPSPSAVVRALGELAATGDLWPATLATSWVALRGVVLAVLVALPLSWLIVHSRRAAAAIEPWIVISQAVPAIALAPLLVLWFGYGTGTTALLAALLVFFPMVIATGIGLRGIDPEVMAAARVDGAGTGQLLAYIEAPLALPQILAGLRAGVALAMTGAVVGEFVIGGAGLGQLLVAQRDRADTAGLFATLFVLASISALAYGIVRILEARASQMTQR